MELPHIIIFNLFLILLFSQMTFIFLLLKNSMQQFCEPLAVSRVWIVESNSGQIVEIIFCKPLVNGMEDRSNGTAKW